MILIIDNLGYHKAKLWLYSEKSIEQISEKEYSGNDLLRFINSFLKKNKIKPEEIKYIGIIEGEGSFTGIRTAANIANVFALYFDTKIFGLETKDLNSKILEKEIKPRRAGSRLAGKKIQYYSPRYSAAPRITIFPANKQKSE